MTVIIIIIR